MTKATCLDALTSTSGANAATGIFVIFHRLPMLYVASVCISWFGGDEGYVNVLSFFALLGFLFERRCRARD